MLQPLPTKPPTPILSPSHLQQFLLFHKPAATAPHALHCKRTHSLAHVCRQANKSRTECRLGHHHYPSVAGVTAPTAKRGPLQSHPGSQPEELQPGRDYRPYPCLPEEPVKAPNPQQPLGMLHSQPAMHLSSSSSSIKAVDLRRRQSLSGACLQTDKFLMIQLQTGMYLMIILQSQGQGSASSSLQVRSSRQGCPRGLSKGSAKGAWSRQATRCRSQL